jgi:hypothetical protein
MWKVGEFDEYCNCELVLENPISYCDIKKFEDMKRQKHPNYKVRVLSFQKFE